MDSSETEHQLEQHCELSNSIPPADAQSSDKSSSTISSPVSSSNTNGDVEIPDHWHPEVAMCLDDKCLTSGVRNDIVRTLVNLLFSRFNKPSRFQYDDLARKLIMKYPCVKDDLGN